MVISGQGLLEGASITVPVESLQGVLSQLGLVRRLLKTIAMTDVISGQA